MARLGVGGEPPFHQAVRTPIPTNGCALGGFFPQRERERVEVVLLRMKRKLMSCTIPYKNCLYPKSFLDMLFELQRCLRSLITQISIIKKIIISQPVPDRLTGVHHSVWAWADFIRRGES